MRMSRQRIALPTLLGTVVGGIALAFVFGAIAGQWSDVRDKIGQAHVGWLLVAFAAASAAMIWIAAC